MGFRFRKVFNAGPVRASCSGRGMGYSIGFPGLRFGITADDRRFVSVGIPGTGLYYQHYFRGKKK